MFHNISEEMLARMRELEAVDQRDRADGTPHERRLRQVVPETAQLIALLAAAAPDGAVLEIGTSGGYSGMWLSLACRERGRKLITFEILPEKAKLARDTFRIANVEALVEVVEGDARSFLDRYPQIGFAFFDAEKEVYQDAYEQIVPRLVPGGIIAADNATSHALELEGFLARARHDPRVDALLLTVGKGVLVCRKVGA
jgi:caffeoyl-CoA O-methyltransferase